MRFTAELAPLLAAVKRARSTVEARQTIPILGHVHIKAADNDVRIAATNLDEWVAVKCEASVAEPGAACVDAGLLLSWLSALPKGSLVNASIVNSEMVATAGRATAAFATMHVDDFPTPAKRDKGEEIIGALDALRLCLPFSAEEDTRYYLNGVAISVGHAVATDGHRLCAVNISAPETIAAIVPVKGVRQIVQFGAAARLWISPTSWRCEDAGVVAGGKLIEGTFPDWKRIIPTGAPKGTADADALAEALSQVIMAAGDKARGVKMTGADEGITLHCQGPAMTATGSAAYDGESFEMGINGKYADAALRVFSGNVMSIAISDACAVLKSDALPDVRVVVMGMRI